METRERLWEQICERGCESSIGVKPAALIAVNARGSSPGRQRLPLIGSDISFNGDDILFVSVFESLREAEAVWKCLRAKSREEKQKPLHHI